jgi:hypothetical protein
MMSTEPRPRSVEVAFWAWSVAAVLLVALGILLITAQAPFAFFRGAGIIGSFAGLAIGYIAGRTRRGDARFCRAGVVLSMLLTVLLAIFAVWLHGVAWAVPGIPLMVGAYAAIRPSATEWLETAESGTDSA